MSTDKCEYIMTEITNTKLSQLKTLMNNVLVNQQKGFYTSQKIMIVQYLYLFLLIIYIGIWIGSISVLYGNAELDNVKKFTIMAILFIIPFVTLKILIYTLSFIQYIYGFVPKNVYLL